MCKCELLCYVFLFSGDFLIPEEFYQSYRMQYTACLTQIFRFISIVFSKGVRNLPRPDAGRSQRRKAGSPRPSSREAIDGFLCLFCRQGRLLDGRPHSGRPRAATVRPTRGGALAGVRLQGERGHDGEEEGQRGGWEEAVQYGEASRVGRWEV